MTSYLLKYITNSINRRWRLPRHGWKFTKREFVKSWMIFPKSFKRQSSKWYVTIDLHVGVWDVIMLINQLYGKVSEDDLSISQESIIHVVLKNYVVFKWVNCYVSIKRIKQSNSRDEMPWFSMAFYLMDSISTSCDFIPFKSF